MPRISRMAAWTMVLSLVSAVAFGQAPPAANAPGNAPHYAEALYLQLRSVGLDRSRVFKVHDLSLDRDEMHLTLDDGTIGFTEDVQGRVTGAFFEGDGEVLLVPPDKAERESMALFTGAAILEEQIITAYLRFNDQTYRELTAKLLPAEHAEEFVAQWNETAKNLAESDALRLFTGFSRLLPGGPADAAAQDDPSDRLLHARLQGRKLGIFDIYYDSAIPEVISAGQLRTAASGTFYDVWTSFGAAQRAPRATPTPKAGQQKQAPIRTSHYKIRVEVKPPTEISAEASLDLEAGSGGQRTVLFELSRFLQIKQVTANGSPVEYIHNQSVEGTQLARRGNDVVAVVFPQTLTAGQRVRLSFTYSGEV